MEKFGIFLVTIALIVGITGCDGYTPPSKDLEIRDWYDLDAVRNNLGGNYTLMLNGNLAQIAGQDGDAIGKEATAIHTDEDPCKAQQVPDKYAVLNSLKTCYDPEIPVNVVDLGLIYDLEITLIEDCSYQVDIKLTLTAPGCGMGEYIAADVKRNALMVSGITEANVELVWEPLWNREMMSDAARLELGMF